MSRQVAQSGFIQPTFLRSSTSLYGAAHISQTSLERSLALDANSRMPSLTGALNCTRNSPSLCLTIPTQGQASVFSARPSTRAANSIFADNCKLN